MLTGLAKAAWCVLPTDTHSSFSTGARQLEVAVKFFWFIKISRNISFSVVFQLKSGADRG